MQTAFEDNARRRLVCRFSEEYVRDSGWCPLSPVCGGGMRKEGVYTPIVDRR